MYLKNKIIIRNNLFSKDLLNSKIVKYHGKKSFSFLCYIHILPIKIKFMKIKF